MVLINQLLNTNLITQVFMIFTANYYTNNIRYLFILFIIGSLQINYGYLF